MEQAAKLTGLNKARARVFDDIRALVETMDPHQWKKMWLEIGSASPRSATSNRPYRGYNRWRLTAQAMQAGYKSHRWLTLGQIRANGGRVLDGEFNNPTIVELWSPKRSKKSDAKEKPGTEEGKQEKSKKLYSGLMYRWYRVWNVDQCEGLPEKIVQGPKATVQAFSMVCEKVEELVEASKANVSYGHDSACFIPSPDQVQMPDKAAFKGDTDEERAAHFYSTLLHEMGHWTGHKSRLDRIVSTFFGSEEYAREELVAELCSAFLCADLGVPMKDVQHPEYLANWLQKVKDDPSALTTAANKASQASNYLLKFLDQEVDQDEDDENASSPEKTEEELVPA